MSWGRFSRKASRSPGDSGSGRRGTYRDDGGRGEALCGGRGTLEHSVSLTETPQSTTAFARFVREIQGDPNTGRGVGVHCRASIDRSSLLLAAVLCAEGFSPGAAFQRLSTARGMKVPDTSEQMS